MTERYLTDEYTLDGAEADPLAELHLEPLLRPSDVARRLGVSRTWLYEAAKEGRVPSVRLGGPDGPLRFIEADLAAWIDQARAGWRPGESPRETARRAAAAIRAA